MTHSVEDFTPFIVKSHMVPVAGFASQKPSFVRGHILGERLKNPYDRL